MIGKNFITACKWISGGWAFCFCTLLLGQAVTRPLPVGMVVGRHVDGALHRKIKPPTGEVHSPRIRMDQAYGKLPLSFEPNQGQTNSAVQFLSRGQGYTLFLTGSEAVLTLKKWSVVSGQLPDDRSQGGVPSTGAEVRSRKSS